MSCKTFTSRFFLSRGARDSLYKGSSSVLPTPSVSAWEDKENADPEVTPAKSTVSMTADSFDRPSPETLDSFDNPQWDDEDEDEAESKPSVPPPFPAEFAVNAKGPSDHWEFAFETFQRQPDGDYLYRGKVYTPEETEAERQRLEAKYPIIAEDENGKRRQWEAITRDPAIRAFCFEQCRPLDEVVELPEAFRHCFFLDPYGNVVSPTAEVNAPTYADIDHNFPRARGGGSKTGNLSAVYWHANRHVKKDVLLAAAEDAFLSKMRCGVQVEDIREILRVYQNRPVLRKRAFEMLEQDCGAHLHVRRDKGETFLARLVQRKEQEIHTMMSLRAAVADSMT